VTTNRRAIVMMFDCSSVCTPVCPSGAGVHCDHTVHNALCTLTPKHVHLLPAVFSSSMHVEERKVYWCAN